MARNQKLSIDIEANDKASGKIDKVADKADQLDKKSPKVKVDADTSKAEANLEDLIGKLEDMDVPVGNIASKLGKGGGAAIGVAAIVGGLAAAADAAAEVAVEAENLSTLTGDSVENASRLNEIWKRSGADTKDLQDVLLQMNGVLADDAELAEKLGVNLADGATVGERFQEVAAALDGVEDSAERSRIASKVFGEEGVRQYNALRNAVGDVGQAMRDVPDAAVIDADEVKAAREMQAEMRELNAEFQAFATAIGSVVVPALSGLIGGLNATFDGAERLGQKIRSVFDGGAAEANRKFADSIDQAEASAAAFDKTLLDGVDTFAEARDKALAYAKEVGNVGDENHFANTVALAYKATVLDVAGAQTSAGQAFRDSNRALGELNSQYDDTHDAARDAARATEALKREFQALKGEISDRQAFRDLQDQFDELESAATESWNASSEGAEDAEAKARDHEAAVDDLRLEVIRYGDELGNLPPETTTEILALIDRGKITEAETLLGHLARPRTITISTRLAGGQTVGALLHNVPKPEGAGATGGIVNRPTVALIGEAGPEAVVPLNRTPGNGPLPGGLGGGNVYLTVNAGFGANGGDIGRLIVEELRKFQRFNGPGWQP